MLNILTQLKNFDADRLSIEELVALSAGARLLRQEFEALQLDVPEVIELKLKSITREIHTRNAENIAKALREKKLRLDALKTPQEKKAELRKEISALEKQLAEV